MLAFNFLAVVLAAVVAFGADLEPTPEQRQLAEVYTNFSLGVVEALAKDDAEAAAAASSSGGAAHAPGALPPVTLSSLVGLTHILAVAHEKPWPMSVPVFEALLEKTPKNLPESYALLASTVEKDPTFKASSLVFTSEKFELSPPYSKLKLELVNTDLKNKDSVNTINAQLVKAVVTPLEQNFIPKDMTISPAAIALMVDTLHLTETWSTPLKKITGLKFNGKDDVDFVEMVGKFQVLESAKAVEVFIPFQNEKRGISLLLPYDKSSAMKGDFGEGKPLELSSVRVQLPAFKVTTRGAQASLASSAKCNFKKEENFLQLLDELSYMSLDENKFEAISIAGAQLNNVAAFKKELEKGNKGKAIEAGPENKLEGEAAKPAAAVAPAPASGKEKLIVFDRSFTLSILDENLGPLFAGSVDSLAWVKNPSAPPKSDGPSVFGSGRSLPFEKCL